MIVASAYGLYTQLVLDIPFGTNHMSNTVLLITTFIAVSASTIMLIFFLFARLETVVSKQSFYFRFIPLINKPRIIRAVNIDYCEIRKYHPIKDFGGWGIRYNRKEKTMCYNVRGNLGLLIVLKNGKRILFGSQNPHKFKQAIDKLIGVNKI